MLAFLVLLAVGGAALFSQADQAQRITTDVQMLGDVEAATADTATYRAALVIAFASIDDAVSPVALEAIREASDVARRISQRLDTYPALGANATALAEMTDDVNGRLIEGEITAARELVETEVLPTVSQLATDLSQTSATVAGRIQAEQAQAGGLARAASFVVALIVPVLAVVTVRRNARLRSERERLESEMLRQRELAETRDRLIAGQSHQLRTPITRGSTAGATCSGKTPRWLPKVRWPYSAKPATSAAWSMTSSSPLDSTHPISRIDRPRSRLARLSTTRWVISDGWATKSASAVRTHSSMSTDRASDRLFTTSCPTLSPMGGHQSRLSAEPKETFTTWPSSIAVTVFRPNGSRTHSHHLRMLPRTSRLPTVLDWGLRLPIRSPGWSGEGSNMSAKKVEQSLR